ncbi:uncharacterized protein Z520_08223 [Fonsecaea multimorphosa CBS 102226]|uniref:GPR1/FUN34/YaaH-class plasma membrane protein n=1 Tax=Fonsecaea multimorphosa CBS 102226 TaxID=1442371 RepID=A0A0D2KH52_9EURO|nr:uncharacterized protein Z520_08223 [Fonsecaea multimorphosa CBS 102226]KIX95968.1 hypothetical protein Z520_08223 [Fonsecaea multimorphosa CBS 102226]OAL21739.1 hypothetical protein AYO22_07681 [Fonsecaea multimorphosa]
MAKSADLEKNSRELPLNNGESGIYDLHHDHHDPDHALNTIRTAGSVSISAELFEKIYLTPKNRVSNNIRSTFGNPTPLCLVGFLLCVTPLSNVLMGWRGAGGLGAAEVGAYYFFGGLLMVIGCVFELILGNTFPCVVFASFGAFWLTFAATLTPFYNASIAYQPNDPASSSSNPVFTATFGYFHLYMGLLCLVYLICSLRTNIIFLSIFATLVPAFGCLTGYFWKASQGIDATNLVVAAGAITFVTSLLGWYLLVVQLLLSVDFPLTLPVGDLSHLIRGAGDMNKKTL